MNDPPERSAATVRYDGVTKRYGAVTAINDVDLTIEGGLHCLLGPNGSGKSTLLRLAAGLTQPTAGTVEAPADIGVGFQRPSFYRGLTVRENVETFASLLSVSDRDWLQTLVDELRLNRALDRRAGELSDGFARKLDLALAFLRRPSVVALDEPLGALDDLSRERFLTFAGAYASEQLSDGSQATDETRTVLVATHRLADFHPHVDRVAVLYRGELVVDRLGDEVDTDRPLQDAYIERLLNREEIDPG